MRPSTQCLDRVVYCSRATVPTESLLVIAEILSVSQRNNDRDGLTGAICEGWFLQVLEGPPAATDGLLRRLGEDPRHRDVEILLRAPVVTRLFSNWTMASARITPSLGPHLKGLIDNCRIDPERAVVALRRIVSLADEQVEETLARAGG